MDIMSEHGAEDDDWTSDDFKYTSVHDIYAWLNNIKNRIQAQLVFHISVNTTKFLGVCSTESYARIVIFAIGIVQPLRIIHFKENDTKKNHENRTVFEAHFAKIFQRIKMLPVDLQINCNFRPGSRLWKLPDFQIVKSVHEKFPDARFSWLETKTVDATKESGRLIGKVDVDTDNFKEILDRASVFGNILLDFSHNNIYENDKSYDAIKESLWCWLGHTHVGLVVPGKIFPLLKLILILLPGLARPERSGEIDAAKHEADITFHDFLTKGLYDPRLFLFIEDFSRPYFPKQKTHLSLGPFYQNENVSHVYFPAIG